MTRHGAHHDSPFLDPGLAAQEQRTRDLEALNASLEEQIAARLRAEQIVREGQRELREYIDRMSTLNAKVALDGTLLLVNRIAEIASGLSRDDLMRTNFLDGQWWAYDPEVQARVRAAFQRAVAGEMVTYEERLFVFGRVVTISFSLSPVRDDEGQVQYIVAEGRDITPQKQAEEALWQRTHELEEANKELEAFGYSVSHDLRAPLRAIEGFSHILMEEHARRLDPEALRLLERVRDNARQMARLIGDLLELSRLSRHALARSRVALSELVRGVLIELPPEPADRRVEVVMAELPVAWADPALLKQVYVNLLSNAFKYTRDREHARIEVGFVPDDSTHDENVYYVRDNGVGFDMQYANRLFGVFQRLHRAEDFEGAGVGLAIVQRIVYRHGGRVWAEAAPDRGATFHFTLGERRTS